MSQRQGESSTMADREKQRQKHRSKLAKALNEDDDPLAAYHQFIQWTIKTYGEKDPKSGLLDLLKEATGQFKQDPMYKNDLRYLKMWALYARQLDRAGAIAVFAFLVANDIGTSYAALYEDYANLLEHDGKLNEAEKLYLKGIERSVRPLERLKTRYKDFQSRAKQKASITSASHPSSSSSSRSLTAQGRTASTSSVSSTSAQSTTSANIVSFNSTAASRYALMLAPPPPGKRPEKLRFNMGLLFTDEGVEYSIQEARARSMGLLGKKWGPPPPSELPTFYSPSSSSSMSSSTPVDFNDDNQKSTRVMGRRRSTYGGGAEPTVTINTKEALADVFGMYNSPDKTSKLDMPGSKHAPLKKVEPVTPMVPPRATFSKENENSAIGRTPGSAFRPFVDENAPQGRATPGTKFNVFVEEQNKTPFVTPRSVFGAKDAATPSFSLRPPETAPRSAFKPLDTVDEDQNNKPVFPKVFNPPESEPIPLAPLRDVFTDDHGKPTPKAKPLPTHERAKSHHDIPTGKITDLGPVFTPFIDENAKTPFKVFSRPQDENPFRNAFTPKTPTPSVFTPFTDKTPAFTPFGSREPRAFTPFAEKPLAPAPVVEEATEILDPEEQSYEEEQVEEEQHHEEEEQHDHSYDPEPEHGEQEEEYYDEEDGEHLEQYETPLAPEHLPNEYDHGSSFQRDVPLGGRFGQFNVMTPITERTFEFGTSTSTRTPSERYSRPLEGEGSPKSKIFVPFLRDEIVAAADAERLAAELHEGGSWEDGTVEASQPEAPSETMQVEERTGTLSLGDTLTLTAKFRPANPCNPFTPPILSTLLSRIPTDPHFYDLRDRPSQTLERLHKSFKKTGRKGSAAGGDIFPLTINDNRFQISEKIGEGGFGSVYKARDIGTRHPNEDSDEEDSDLDDDDDDMENASFVAIKVVSPRNLWEYHVLRRLHSSISPTLRRSVILPHALYAFSDESFLILDFCPQGMLLDIVNNAAGAGISQAGACLDELLVIFFSIELLRLLEGMHSIGFVHGDLKIDNCLIRLEDVPGGASAWSPQYEPSGAGGWSHKGLKVIDFGRTIDTRLFPPGQQFIADWPTDDRDCFEIQQNKPWTYQTDYFGLAGIVYCMLFGKYMSAGVLVQQPDERGQQKYKIGTPFKRYWQAEIWERLFDILLNPRSVRSGGDLPLCEELGAVRKDMEVWLQANCNRTSNTLKGLLKKVELSCYRV